MLCVGASLLAKDVNDNAGFLDKRVVLGFFASKLAPTVAGAEAGHVAFQMLPRAPAAALQRLLYFLK